MRRWRGWKRLRRGRAPLVLAILPAVVTALALIILVGATPGLWDELRTAWGLLVEGDPDPLRTWLYQFGIWAPVVSGLLQLVTSLFPPLPSFLVAIANAMLYGPLLGGVLTFVTAVVAAGACFALARFLGRPGVERIVSRPSLQRVDDFMKRRGIWAVFVARLIPFINPDVVSYAAGVTRIGWVPFLAAIAAGSIPAVAFYSIVGGTAVESTLWVSVMVAAATFIPVILLVIYILRTRKNEGLKEQDGEGATSPP